MRREAPIAPGLKTTMRQVKRHAKNFFIGGDNFKREFRKQFRLLIIVTLAFTIAFTWRQTVFDTIEFLVIFFTHVENSAYASILTSVAITIISLGIIYITSQALKDRSSI